VSLSAQECRDNVDRCEIMANSLGPANAELQETMREIAAQWRRLAADAGDDHIAMCLIKAVRHDVPLPSVHLPPGTSKGNKIEHRLFSFITQNDPHRDQSQNPLGACMLSRTGGLAKGAGWLPTPTERCKLFFPCARALLLCSRPR